MCQSLFEFSRNQLTSPSIHPTQPDYCHPRLVSRETETRRETESSNSITWVLKGENEWETWHKGAFPPSLCSGLRELGDRSAIISQIFLRSS